MGNWGRIVGACRVSREPKMQPASQPRRGLLPLWSAARLNQGRAWPGFVIGESTARGRAVISLEM